MTMLGKILVFVNLALSVVLCAVGLVFFTNRIDWTTSKGEPPTMEPGALSEAKTELDTLWTKVPSAVYTWDRNRNSLLKIENGARAGGSLTDDRKWYYDQLTRLLSGATPQSPVQQVVVTNGVIQLDANNFDRPRLGRAQDQFSQDLLSLDYYDAEEKKVFDQISQVRMEYQMAIDEDTRLTKMLIDDPDTGFKGLKTRIEDEKFKLANAKEEHKIVKPQLINSTVDSELIIKRRYDLEARRRELQKALGQNPGPGPDAE